VGQSGGGPKRLVYLSGRRTFYDTRGHGAADGLRAFLLRRRAQTWPLRKRGAGGRPARGRIGTSFASRRFAAESFVEKSFVARGGPARFGAPSGPPASRHPSSLRPGSARPAAGWAAALRAALDAAFEAAFSAALGAAWPGPSRPDFPAPTPRLEPRSFVFSSTDGEGDTRASSPSIGAGRLSSGPRPVSLFCRPLHLRISQRFGEECAF
jgi:hypothetical protein